MYLRYVGSMAHFHTAIMKVAEGSFWEQCRDGSNVNNCFHRLFPFVFLLSSPSFDFPLHFFFLSLLFLYVIFSFFPSIIYHFQCLSRLFPLFSSSFFSLGSLLQKTGGLWDCLAVSCVPPNTSD
jgi:hypothetical protein